LACGGGRHHRLDDAEVLSLRDAIGAACENDLPILREGHGMLPQKLDPSCKLQSDMVDRSRMMVRCNACFERLKLLFRE
jgi:hypothetical protein